MDASTRIYKMKLLSIIKKSIKKYRARWNGAPYTIEKHWQAYWITFNSEGRLLDDKFTVLPFTVAGSWHGQIHPVLKIGDIYHFYEIVGRTIAPGYDHIVSPIEWWLEYHHTEYEIM